MTDKKKDLKQSIKRKERNRYYGKTTRNVIRELRESAAASPAPDVVSMIEKLARRGVIHKNKAAALKSKLKVKNNAVVYLSAEEELPLRPHLNTETDYIELIRTGVTKKSIDHLINTTEITVNEMAQLMEITPRKLAAIKPDVIMEKSQSEKAVNIARLYSLGEEVFDSKEEFNKWMNGRVPALGNKKPKEYLDTTTGINLLMDELVRIQHGVYS